MELQTLLGNYSIEMTTKDRPHLGAIKGLLPANMRISIAFLPGDNIGDLIATAACVRDLGFTPVPHVSARRLASQDELHRYLGGLSDEAGVDQIFVVAGDASRAAGPYEDAMAVIGTGLLRSNNIIRVGIAGYPEGHPQFSNELLWQALHQKYKALLQQGHSVELLTQFSFNAEPVASWLRRLTMKGIGADVGIGVSGPASVQSLLRFAAKCGVGASAKVMSKHGVSITRLLSTATPDRFISTLASALPPTPDRNVRLHIYPFGGMKKTAEWASTLQMEFIKA